MNRRAEPARAEVIAEAPIATVLFDRLVMAATVARRHYLDGQSKVDIADKLGISRFQVARLIDLAHAAGMVTITVRDLDDDTW